MTWQKHIIKKQVIELQITKGIDSREVQSRVSQILREQILQQLDKCLGDISPPGTIDKIDRLELNLGPIRLSQLEKELREKIEAELLRTISIVPKLSIPAQTKNDNRDVQKSGNDLDLVTYFLQTGVLPWWTTAHTRQTFEKALEECQATAPSQLRMLLQELLHHEDVLTRLIYSCDDKTLYRIVEIYMPGASAATEIRKAKWEKLFKGSRDYQRFRELWWISVFHAAINEGKLPVERFAELVAAAFAVQAPEIQALLTGSSDKEVLTGNGDLRGSGLKVYSGHVETAIEELLAYVIMMSEMAGTKDGSLPHLERITEKLARLKKAFEAAKADHVADAERHQILSGLKAGAGEFNDLLSRVMNEKAALEMIKLDAMLRHVIAMVEPVNTTPVSKRARESSSPALPHHQKQSRQSKKLYDPFSETEKIFVQNAGLVLLWPFLNRFFQNLGFANEKLFVDERAAEKACLMLQYLTGAPMEELFEAQLPLNKVMCGIDLEQPVNTQWVVQPDEAEAAENFLVAVIQNGPLWKTLSANGFRQSYLNREGALSTRDGNWLLQVKRETYDVIVDRLPWTVQVVKLPWMERLIFVEW